MKINLLLFAVIFFNLLGCAYPTQNSTSPSNPGGPINAQAEYSGDPKAVGVMGVAAKLTEMAIGTKDKTIGQNDLVFKCEVYLKNESVPNVRLCQGIAFLVSDRASGKQLIRLFPNERGAFGVKGQKDNAYLVTVERPDTWKVVEEGPFFTGREYRLTLKQN